MMPRAVIISTASDIARLRGWLGERSFSRSTYPLEKLENGCRIITLQYGGEIVGRVFCCNEALFPDALTEVWNRQTSDRRAA